MLQVESLACGIRLSIGSARRCCDMAVLSAANQYHNLPAVLRMSSCQSTLLPCCACCDALAHLRVSSCHCQNFLEDSVRRYNNLSSLCCSLRLPMLCQSAYENPRTAWLPSSPLQILYRGSGLARCLRYGRTRAADEIMNVQITTRSHSSSSRLVIAVDSRVSVCQQCASVFM